MAGKVVFKGGARIHKLLKYKEYALNDAWF